MLEVGVNGVCWVVPRRACTDYYTHMPGACVRESEKAGHHSENTAQGLPSARTLLSSPGVSSSQIYSWVSAICMTMSLGVKFAAFMSFTSIRPRGGARKGGRGGGMRGCELVRKPWTWPCLWALIWRHSLTRRRSITPTCEGKHTPLFPAFPPSLPRSFPGSLPPSLPPSNLVFPPRCSYPASPSHANRRDRHVSVCHSWDAVVRECDLKGGKKKKRVRGRRTYRVRARGRDGGRKRGSDRERGEEGDASHQTKTWARGSTAFLRHGTDAGPGNEQETSRLTPPPPV